MSAKRGFLRTISIATILLVATTFASAGPPLICWRVETGAAPSLPWTMKASTYEGMQKDYATARLAADTLALLAPATPVLERMETLRRAALYASTDTKAGEDLLAALVDRTQRDASDGLAWFDAGYFIEASRQARGKNEPDFWTRFLEATGMRATDTQGLGELSGYDCVAKAIELRRGDAALEYAAALISWHPRRPEHEGHVQRAALGATEGSLLEKNLLTHFGDRGKTLGELRAATR